MGFDRDQPVVTDSLATSAPLLAANFSALESVLGSSTLSAGLTKVQGDLLYCSDAETIQKLAKNTTASRYLSNQGTNNNPSWTPINLSTGVTNILGTANGGTGSNAFTLPALGAWVDKSASYSAQQATTDGFVVVNIYRDTSTNLGLAQGYTDSGTNPTTLRCHADCGWTGAATEAGQYATFTMPVKKGDYWKVVWNSVGTMYVYWIPFGN